MRLYILLVLLTLLQGYAYSGEITFIEKRLPKVGYSYIKSNHISGTDTVIVNPKSGSNFKDYGVSAQVELGIDLRHSKYYGDSLQTEVTLQFYDIKAQNNSSLLPFTHTFVLKYHPNSDKEYIDRAVMRFDKAYEYKSKVTGIKVNGVLQDTLPKNIYIKHSIGGSRYYDLAVLWFTSANSVFSPVSLVDKDCDGVHEEIELIWSTVVGAEEYELEWAFINDYGTQAGTYVPASSLEYDFKHNSSRITTTNNRYVISNIFDHGYVVYRLRPVGRDKNAPQNLVYGSWNRPHQGLVNSFGSGYYHNTQGFELTKNWSYSAGYAEGGKKQEGLSFMDGSLRSRQSIGKLQSEDKAVVSEVMYDYQGRAVIQVMPGVVEDPANCSNATKASTLKFYNKFNQDDSLQAYGADDFDRDVFNSTCDPITSGMSTSSGASKYYSPANPEKTLQQGYVADAKKYPFSQVEYMPDATGRIRTQTGVGADFNMGSTHETKYFYGKPSQAELDKLFGLEVGDASHYQKNMVIDPQGLVSISYVDLSGKTIATALSGDSVQGMQSLASKAGSTTTMKEDLFSKDFYGKSLVNTLNTRGDAIEFTRELMVSSVSPITYAFTYDDTITNFTDACLNNICYSCVYELALSIKDDCGDVLYTQDTLIGRFSMSGGNVIFSTACSPNTYTSRKSTSINLTAGVYTISKRLSIYKPALEHYLQEYLDDNTNTCIKTLDDFTSDYMALVDTSGCGIDCDAYQAFINEKDVFIAKGGSLGEYEALLQEYKRMCERGESVCASRYEMMLLDVSPRGQYADFIMQGDSISTDSPGYELSLYKTDNRLPKSIQAVSISQEPKTWRTPFTPYTDQSGKSSLIEIQKTGTNSYSPEVLDPSQIIISSDGLLYIKPEGLKHATDFISLWEPSWAKSLVNYHPEYCLYEDCKGYDVALKSGELSSEDFDFSLEKAQTYVQAQQAGFINSSGNGLSNWFATSSPVYDGFVVSSGGVPNVVGSYNYSQMLKDSVLTYKIINGTPYSMLQMASITARCPSSLYGGGGIPASCYSFGTNLTSGANPLVDTKIKDKEWALLKGFYKGSKTKLQALKRNRAAISCKAINECMGDDAYTGYSGAGLFWFNAGSFISDDLQPCSKNTYELYALKQARFLSDTPLDKGSIDSLSMKDQAAETFLSTGECPNGLNIQNLLTELASYKGLDNTQSISYYGSIGSLFMGLYKYSSQAIIPNDATWQASVVGNVISGQLRYNGNTESISFILNKGASSLPWDAITQCVGFKTIFSTAVVGGNSDFEVYGLASIAGVDSLIKIEGSVNIQLQNCDAYAFDCEPLTISKEIQTLMSALAQSGQLMSTSSVTLGNTLGAGVYKDYLGSALQSSVYAGASGTFSYSWKRVTSPSAFFELTCSDAPSKTLEIYINNTIPSGYNLSTVKYFKNIEIDSVYHGHMDGYDALGNKLVRVYIYVKSNVSSTRTNVALGDCLPIESTECDGLTKSFKNYLSNYFGQKLPFFTPFINPNTNQNPPNNRSGAPNKGSLTRGSEPINNGPLAPQATGYVPGQGCINSMVPLGQGSSSVVGSIVYDTLTFTSQCCDYTKVYHQSTVGAGERLSDIVSTRDFYTFGEVDENGFAHEFLLVALFSNGTVDTMYGQTCFDLASCNPCGERVFVSHAGARGSSLENGTTATAYNSCPSLYAQYTQKAAQFNTFLGSNTVLQAVYDTVIIESAAIIEKYYCGCIESYIEMLDQAMLGYVQVPVQASYNASTQTNLSYFCQGFFNQPCPLLEPSLPISTPYTDPCVENQIAQAQLNAKNAYQIYIDSVSASFVDRYKNHCMGIKEDFIAQYAEGIYHYTLFYYDQAGNLIKTIPPQGVELLDVSSGSSVSTQLKKDRALGTRSVFTQHRLESIYSYNSLNQLTKQGLPDHDKIDVFETSLSDGLRPNLQITEVQFINAQTGYLTGNDGSRGYLYRTTDGGKSYQGVENIVGSDFLNVQFAGSTGYAVGTQGVFLKSTDGGSSWDLYNLYANNEKDTLTSLYVYNANTIVIGSSNGSLYKSTNGGTTFIKGSVSGGAFAGGSIRSITFDGVYVALVTYPVGAVLTSAFYISTDGLTWTKENNFVYKGIYNVHLFEGTGNSVKGYACGKDGLLLYTENSTDSWRQVPTRMTGLYKDIYFYTSTTGIAIIEKDNTRGLYKTTNGGLDWDPLSATGEFYTSLFKGKECLALGKNGLIQKISFDPLSSSLGASYINAPAQVDLLSGSVSGNYIVVAGPGDTVYYTHMTNYPYIWTSYNTGLTALDSIVSMALVNTSGNRLSGVFTTKSGKLHNLHKKNIDPALYITQSGLTGVFTNILVNKNITTPSTGLKRLFTVFEKNTLRVHGISQVMDQDIAPSAAIALGSAFTGMASATGMSTHHNTLCLIDSLGNFKKALFTTTNYDVLANPVSVQTFYPTKLASVFYSGQISYAVGDNGRVWQRASLSWSPMVTHTRADISKLVCYSNQLGYMACKNGILYKVNLNPGGQSPLLLTRIETNTTLDLYDIALSSNEIYVSGDKGFIMYGSSPQTTPVMQHATVLGSFALKAIALSPASGAIALGTNGHVQWNIQTTSGKNNQVFVPTIKDVHFYNAHYGMIAANKYTLRYTSDGGSSWKVVLPNAGFTNGAIAQIEKVFTKAPNQVFAVGSLSGRDHLIKIYDQKAYAMIAPILNNQLYDIVFTSSQNGYAAGRSNTGKPLIRVSTNGGNSWTIVQDAAASSGQHILSIEPSLNNNSLIVAGTNNYLKTFINNTTFSAPFTTSNIPSGAVYKDICMLDDYNGYVVGASGIVVAFKNLQTTLGQYSAGSLERKPTRDFLNGQVDSAKMDIAAIDFSSSTRGCMGGAYNASGGTITPLGYGRFINSLPKVYSSLYFYDPLGRLVLSQNTKQHQRPNKQYSYVLFDALGRATQAGQKTENQSTTGGSFKDIFGVNVQGQDQIRAIDVNKMLTWIENPLGAREEVTLTYYDKTSISGLPASFTQQNLRKRVASVVFKEVFDTITTSYTHATHYTYDIHGNVNSLLQDNPQTGVSTQRFKRTDYSYDLISGNVNKVSYQSGAKDQWHHKYSYDLDNRLQSVYTSTDNTIFDLEAKYFYYQHGPLARVELSKNQVQGLDYMYALQGWIKGVNSNTLQTQRDPGKDGNSTTGNPNKSFAPDAFAYSLHYFINDFYTIEPSYLLTANRPIATTNPTSDLMSARSNLYNGNISAMVTTLRDSLNQAPAPMGYAYQYDVLNRLKQLKAFSNVQTLLNTWSSGNGYANSYYNTFSYDASGNILAQDRHNAAGALLDKLSYNYPMLGGKLIQNRLLHVDELNSVTADLTDIEDQAPLNYTYSPLGELVADASEQIQEVIWRVDGKIKEIKRPANSPKKNLKFSYDASGKRIAKHIHTSAGSWEKSTFYSYDAQGNVIAIYEKKNVAGKQQFNLIERNIYGSTRIGRNTQTVALIASKIDNPGGDTPVPTPWPGGGGGSARTSGEPSSEGNGSDYSARTGNEPNNEQTLFGPPPPAYISKSFFNYTLGKKHYELSNHLGNVLTVVSDKVIALDADQNGLLDGVKADLISVADYYPFGAIMTERAWEKKDYRYGFNTQEKVDEIAGEDNHTTAEFWEYDTRLARRWNLDPKPNPSISDYACLANSPIFYKDPLGDSIIINLFNSLENMTYKTGERLAKTQSNDGTFVIFAHGWPGGFQDGGQNRYDTPEEIHNLLSNLSPEWKKAMENGDQIKLRFYSCNAGTINKSSENPIAKRMSETYPNVTTYGGDAYVYYGQNKKKEPAVLGVDAYEVNYGYWRMKDLFFNQYIRRPDAGFNIFQKGKKVGKEIMPYYSYDYRKDEKLVERKRLNYPNEFFIVEQE